MQAMTVDTMIVVTYDFWLMIVKTLYPCKSSHS